MNAYFASVEQQANPFLRGKAIGVTGKRKERTVVAAASREAKRLGVKTAMSTWEATRILPSILLVAGDPEKYGDITRRFNAIFHEFTDQVQQFSVDESFLDITETAGDYLGATVIAYAIKERLREECGAYITASVGIAANKPMAKLASESMKPDGLVVAPPNRVLALLDASELGDLCGIGPRIETRLNELGIFSFAHLREYPLHLLRQEFHSYGDWLHEAAHGRGDDDVRAEEEEQKSYGHSYTLPADTRDPNAVRRYLLTLSDKVAWRMRRDGVAARCVSAHVRYGDFSGAGKEHRFQEATDDGLKIFDIAWGMMRAWNAKPVRLVGVTASGLTRGCEQGSLFQKEQKMTSALSALDQLQTRFGDRAWTRASLLSTNVLDRTSGFRYDHEL